MDSHSGPADLSTPGSVSYNLSTSDQSPIPLNMVEQDESQLVIYDAAQTLQQGAQKSPVSGRSDQIQLFNGRLIEAPMSLRTVDRSLRDGSE